MSLDVTPPDAADAIAELDDSEFLKLYFDVNEYLNLDDFSGVLDVDAELHDPATIQIEADIRFKELYSNQYKYYGYYGGRASGKSYAVADYAIHSALNARENILTVREFGNALDHSSYKLYSDRIKTLGLADFFEINARKITCLTTGSEFSFLGLERNPDKLRSFHDATLTIVEEAQNISEHSFRVLRETVLRSAAARIVCIWNPIYPNDAVNFFFRGKKLAANAFCRKINYTENKYFKDTALQAEVEYMKALDYNKYKHVWEGEYFSTVDARILTNVQYADPTTMDLAGAEPVYGVDFGSTDPNAFIRAYLLDSGVIYIDRVFKERCSLEDFAESVKENLCHPDDIVICDSAWAQSIELLNKYGIDARPARKGAKSILTGLKWLQSHSLLVHPDAKAFMDEALAYTWKIDRKLLNPDGSPMLKRDPIDSNNHLIDALRYATECYRQPKSEFFVMGVKSV